MTSRSRERRFKAELVFSSFGAMSRIHGMMCPVESGTSSALFKVAHYRVWDDAGVFLVYDIGCWRAPMEELCRCATIAFTTWRHDRQRLATS